MIAVGQKAVTDGCYEPGLPAIQTTSFRTTSFGATVTTFVPGGGPVATRTITALSNPSLRLGLEIGSILSTVATGLVVLTTIVVMMGDLYY